jgi:hypothetical protein
VRQFVEFIHQSVDWRRGNDVIRGDAEHLGNVVHQRLLRDEGVDLAGGRR